MLNYSHFLYDLCFTTIATSFAIMRLCHKTVKLKGTNRFRPDLLQIDCNFVQKF